MPFEHSDQTAEVSAQPETVVTLLRQLGVRNASAGQEADALRAWVRDNIPNQALRVSIRRNGYGFVLDRRFGRPPRRSTRPSAAQAVVRTTACQDRAARALVLERLALSQLAISAYGLRRLVAQLGARAFGTSLVRRLIAVVAAE